MKRSRSVSIETDWRPPREIRTNELPADVGLLVELLWGDQELALAACVDDSPGVAGLCRVQAGERQLGGPCA